MRTKAIKKINYRILDNHNELKIKVNNYINKIKASNVFILKKAELEDYITDKGQKIIENLGFADQKELKIIKLTELISNGDVDIQQVIDMEDYGEVIKALNLKN